MQKHLIVIALVFTVTFLTAVSSNDNTLGAWQNPDVGFVLDMVTDASDINGIFDNVSTQGINIRAAELCVSSNIDPFGFLVGNFNFSEHGAALHEGYFILPALPCNLKLKGGHMLANFGRWNQFHTHSMPFTSEPRVYREYLGGHLSVNGLELSWLMPFPFYVELTGSVYDGLSGHTHDSDPVKTGYTSETERLAAEKGYEKHGNHYHAPDGSIVLEQDLIDPNEPSTDLTNLSLSNMAYAGRLTSNLELGLDWSVDIGGSFIRQKAYKQSNRIDDYGYPKMTYGADITLFWHPLKQNLYRNLDFGVELLGNYEGFERVTGDQVYEDLASRAGLFSHIHYMHNPTWHYGAFGEFFQPVKDKSFTKSCYGLFTTFQLTHFQFFRLEISRYDYSEFLDPVHRLMLQYDAVIGYHTHGRQR